MYFCWLNTRNYLDNDETSSYIARNVVLLILRFTMRNRKNVPIVALSTISTPHRRQ